MLVNCLVSKADIISSGYDLRSTDTALDEKECDNGMTIKSAVISMCFELSKEDLDPIEQEIIGALVSNKMRPNSKAEAQLA